MPPATIIIQGCHRYTSPASRGHIELVELLQVGDGGRFHLLLHDNNMFLLQLLKSHTHTLATPQIEYYLDKVTIAFHRYLQ